MILNTSARVVLVTSCTLLTLLSAPSRAQKVTGLSAGATVRLTGDRATNDGVKRFSMRGTMLSVDSAHIVIQPEHAPLDTIALLGLRRLERFDGLRSRRSMIVTGAVSGAVIGVAGWLAGRQFQGSALVPDDNGVMREVYARRLTRYGMVVLPVSGAFLGAVIGRERWTRIGVPMSEFAGAR